MHPAMNTTEVFLIAMLIVFTGVLLDKQIITNETSAALMLMAVAGAILAVPIGAPMLARMKEIVLRSQQAGCRMLGSSNNHGCTPARGAQP